MLKAIKKAIKKTNPDYLNGISGLDKQAVKLKKISEGFKIRQGIYQDDVGNNWYVKVSDKYCAFFEVLAGEYFRFLTGGEISPETKVFLDQEDGACVLSRYHEHLSALPLGAELPRGLIAAIVASYLIADRDCVNSKNIMVADGCIFRFDFGVALQSVFFYQDQKKIPFYTHLGDLRTGFSSSYLRGRINSEDFVLVLKEIASVDPNLFPWSEWQKEADSLENFNLQEIKQAIIMRAQLLLEHLVKVQAGFCPISAVPPTLVEFYRLLNQEKTEDDDFLLFPLTPEQLAAEHLQHYKKENQHPEQFMFLYNRARQAERIQASNFSWGKKDIFFDLPPEILEFATSILTPKPLDMFLIENHQKIQDELDEHKAEQVRSSVVTAVSFFQQAASI